MFWLWTFIKCIQIWAFLSTFSFFTYFWLHAVFLASRGLSLVATSRGYSPAVVHGLLNAVASLRSTWASVVPASGLHSTGSVVVAHELSCPAVCGIFPDQGLNVHPWHWQEDFNHWTIREIPTYSLSLHLINTSAGCHILKSLLSQN